MTKICPYTGLRTFSENESLYFKGRERHVGKCIQLLTANHYLMLTGVSGDGKSSMVFAGIVPQLRAGMVSGKFPNWKVVTFTPKKDPLHSLAEALSTPLDLSCNQISERLQSGFSALLDLYLQSNFYFDENQIGVDVQETRLARKKARNLLLIVDQFEELFTNPENFPSGVPSLGSKLLINLLSEAVSIAAEKGIPFYVVCTMRSDYFSQCAVFNGLPEQIAGSHYFIPRFTREEIKRVISEPAVLSGNRIHPRLVDRLLYDTREGQDVLPVLQHALYRIFSIYQEGGDAEMDLIHYAKIGGMPESELPDKDLSEFLLWKSKQDDAKLRFFNNPSLQNVINAHAGELYELAHKSLETSPLSILSVKKCRTVLKTLFLGLTRSDQGKIVRNRLSTSDVRDLVNDSSVSTDQIDTLLSTFSNEENHLLCVQKIEDGLLYDITHEALIRNWIYLNDWVAEETTNRLIFYDLLLLSQAWVKDEKRKSHLLSEGAFNYYHEWFIKVNISVKWVEKALASEDLPEIKLLNPETVLLDLNELFRKSNAVFERKKMAYRVIFGVICLLLVLSVIGFWKSNVQKNEAILLKNIATANKYAMQSYLIETENPTKALRLAEKAYSTYPSSTATNALLNLYAHGPFYQKDIQCHDFILNNIIVSPLNGDVLTLSSDKKGIIWTTEGSKMVSLIGHTTSVYSGEFSADGKLIWTQAGSRELFIWQSDGNLLSQFYSSHNLKKVCFIDNQNVLLLNDRNELFKLKAGDSLPVLYGEGVTWFSQLPDYGSVMCSYVNGEMKKINREGNEKVLEIPNINCLSFVAITPSELIVLPDRRKICHFKNKRHVEFKFDEDLKTYRLSKDKNVIVYRTDNEVGIINLIENSKVKLTETNQAVSAVSINNTSDKVITIGSEGEIICWNLSGQRLHEFSSGDLCYAAVFSPDDKYLYTCYNAGDMKIWDLQHLTVSNFIGHENFVWSITFDSINHQYATVGWDGKVILWDEKTGHCKKVYNHHTDKAQYMAFSPKGNAFVTCGHKSEVFLIKPESNDVIALSNGDKGSIGTPAYLANGEKIAFVDMNGDLLVFDENGVFQEKKKAHVGVVRFLVNYKGEKFLSVGYDSHVILWDGQTVSPIEEILDHTSPVYAAAFSKSGKYIATGGNDGLAVIRDGRGKSLFRHQLNSSIICAAFSNDETKVAFGCIEGMVTVIDLKTGLISVQTHLHTAMINSLEFSSDDKLLLTSSDDASAKLVDMKGKVVYSFKSMHGGIQQSLFTKDGKHILAVGLNGSFKKWTTDLNEVLKTLKNGSVSPLKESDFKAFDSN